jgi:DNA repair protein RadD
VRVPCVENLSVILRPYQQRLKDNILKIWASGKKNALAVLPTGGGKTILFSSIIQDEQGPSIAIAHRQELVSQISNALARNGVYHRILGPKDVVKFCSAQHLIEFNKSFVAQQAMVTVAGVDTLLSRSSELVNWARSMQLWVCDEAHHQLRENKWGQALGMFTNARGLGVTATPCRADGKGLGRNASGVIDEMTVGPTMRDLITQGFLSDYRIFAPPSDLDLHDVEIGSTGDFKAPQLKKAVQKSHITGDVVEHYLKIASGKLGVTFATDVETATEISHAFNARGVVSAVVSAKTPAANRVEIVRRFRNREIMQLVNVDLFGEGFDLPAIEVVSMARPTQSYGLYCQQFGRALRPLPGKSHAIIIDHVGNVVRHGLPDAPRKWTLEDRSKRSSSGDGGIPCRTCPSCTGVYERVHRCCPYCGFYPAPAERSGPEFVDGDLEELTPETLARLRGGVIDLDTPTSTIAQSYMNQGLPPYIAQINAGRFGKTQEAQRQLREAIGWYGAWARLRGEPDNESQRRFYLKYGVDIISAQALKESDAMELRERVLGDL